MRAAASARTTSRRVLASRTIASRRPSDGSATGSTWKPNPKNGRLDRNTWPAGPSTNGTPSTRSPTSWGRNDRSSAASARDAGDEVGRVRAVVAVSRSRVEARADALDGEQASLRRDDVERVDARRGSRESDARRGLPVGGDAQGAGDVVRPPGGQQRDRREDGEVDVGQRVHGAVAADENEPCVARDVHRVRQVALVGREARTHRRTGGAQGVRRAGGDAVSASRAAGVRVDHELDGPTGTPDLRPTTPWAGTWAGGWSVGAHGGRSRGSPRPYGRARLAPMGQSPRTGWCRPPAAVGFSTPSAATALVAPSRILCSTAGGERRRRLRRLDR